MSDPIDETEPDEVGDIVHWSPKHGAVIGERRGLDITASGTLGGGALAAGAVGALALGALAIGALAIGRLVVGRARLRDVRIDRLEVGDLVLLRRNGRPF